MSISMNPDRIDEIQKEILAWSEYNFGKQHPERPVLGAIEEFGEIAHAVLKRAQGIRGTTEEHDAKIKDGMADFGVFILNALGLVGFKTGLVLSERADFIPDAPVAGGGTIPAAYVVSIGVLVGKLCENFMRAAAHLEDVAAAGEIEDDALFALYDFGLSATLCLAYMDKTAESAGWNYMEILEATWAEVKKRDFRKRPADGGNIKPEETVLREAASAVVDSPTDEDFVPIDYNFGIRDLPAAALRPTEYTSNDDIGGFA
jgi:NTP pyrophosphatase (non-canonical NTP hydrolase)